MNYVIIGLWVLAGALVGSLLSFPVMIVMYIWNCAFPMLHDLRGLDGHFDFDRFRRNLKIVMLGNSAIIAAVIWAVLRFSPKYMQIGLFAALLLIWYIGSGHTGMTKQNIKKFYVFLFRYVRHGKPKEAMEAIYERIDNPLEECQNRFMYGFSKVWNVIAVLCAYAGVYFLFAENLNVGFYISCFVIINSFFQNKWGYLDDYNNDIQIILIAAFCSVTFGLNWLWCICTAFCVGGVLRILPYVFLKILLS